MERATRIGLATEAWEAPILPLNYARICSRNFRLLFHFTIFFLILQAFDGLRGELFLFIVVKFAYYLTYRPDVRERIGIFAYNRLEFAYLSGTYDAYKQLLVVMLEHSDGRRNRDAVSEFGYNLFGNIFCVLCDDLEFKRGFAGKQHLVAYYRRNEYKHQR